MRSIAAAATLFVPFALSACGSPTRTASEPTPSTAPSEVQQRIIGMSEGQRDGVLLRAILDAGQQCQGVTQATRNGDGVPPTYIARCGQGTSFSVAIGPDGTARVTGPLASRTAGAQG